MPVTHFTVFGERCSGTNHAVAWLEKNTGLQYRRDLGWKHGRIPVDRLRKDRSTLCVVVVRNLPDWLRSLHIKPHHLSAKMRGLTLHEFVTRKVDSILDHTMGVSPHNPRFGAALPGEEHNGKPYANVIRMRRHKYRQWMKDLERLPHALLLRHEELLHQPATVYRAIQSHCNLPDRTSFDGISAYKGGQSASTYQPKSYAPLATETAAYIVEQMDIDLETRLGYDSIAEVQAAAISTCNADINLLRTTLAGNPAALAELERLISEIAGQQALLRHADAQRQSQRRYLLTLDHAIKHMRGRFAFWRRG